MCNSLHQEVCRLALSYNCLQCWNEHLRSLLAAFPASAQSCTERRLLTSYFLGFIRLLIIQGVFCDLSRVSTGHTGQKLTQNYYIQNLIMRKLVRGERDNSGTNRMCHVEIRAMEKNKMVGD